MAIQTGKWQVPAGASDLIFSSAAAVTVVLTVRKLTDPVQAISVKVNGAVAPDGDMPQGKTDRTFRFAAVNKIEIAAAASTYSGPYPPINQGDYQITVS